MAHTHTHTQTFIYVLAITQVNLFLMSVYQFLAQIAVRNFTQALIVLLLEALLPTSDEENFVVTADDIRQRRKRVSSDRKVGRFDLTMQNKPAYDMNFLDFVVSGISEGILMGEGVIWDGDVLK